MTRRDRSLPEGARQGLTVPKGNKSLVVKRARRRPRRVRRWLADADQRPDANDLIAERVVKMWNPDTRRWEDMRVVRCDLQDQTPDAEGCTGEIKTLTILQPHRNRNTRNGRLL